MSYKATKEIHEALRKHGLKANIEETATRSMVHVGFMTENTENGSPLHIFFVSRNNDNDVSMRVMQLMHVEEEHVKDVLPVISRINRDFRYVKFVLDTDNNIGVEYDLPLSCDAVGKCALEMTACFVKTIGKAYPELLRAAGQETNEQEK